MISHPFNSQNTANATHAAATVTLPATLGHRWSFYEIHVGYSATPTAPGTLTVTDGGNVVYKIPVVAAGLLVVDFPLPQEQSLPNTALVFTLSDGGAAVIGYVNVVDAVLIS